MIDAKLRQEIILLEEALVRPHCHDDYDLLNQLIHDDFEELNPKGEICYKQQALEWIIRADDQVQWELFDFRLRQLSESIIQAQYKARKIHRKSNEKKISIRSSIWKKKALGWAMIFHQGTNL